jgi:hypothetical protein
LFFHPAIFTEQAGFVKTFKNLLYGVFILFPLLGFQCNNLLLIFLCNKIVCPIDLLYNSDERH